jgi:hypothetical protein
VLDLTRFMQVTCFIILKKITDEFNIQETTSNGIDLEH